MKLLEKSMKSKFIHPVFVVYKLLVFVFIFLVSSPAATQPAELKSLWDIKKGNEKSDVRKADYLNITEEELFEYFDALPSFGMFHDNYFITGMPTNKVVNDNTADAKFQISISQRLTKSILPFNSTLLLTYSQKSFWDIYKDSSPFAENNYNPGLTLVRPILRNNQLRGVGVIAFEHESNGLDSISSRSWNYFVVSGVYFYNANISVQGKLWAGWLGDENKDLLKYRGHGLLALNYRGSNDRFWASAIINPTEKFKSINTTIELNYRPSNKANQYLFLQWYNGYGESLIDYNQYTSMVRVGICIKPSMRNFY
ncbi:phospholipase A [Carboxylicivirga sp. N1Y90]|uniref:phospholipase A n=1 Tax=Carboxylicivirga fragile TaxID=3417571 RepID=UPI003D3340E1|nr:phospholipase A [Marinilabiliaceae bacterium N1Y90]